MTTNQYLIPNLTLGPDDITDVASSSWMPFAAPGAEWAGQIAQYDQLWRHYSGQSLRATVDTAQMTGGQAPLVYPLRINQFSFVANLHAGLMWGQGEDENEFLRFISREKAPPRKENADTSEGDYLSALFWAVWLENGGQETLREASRMYQIFGGHVFKVVHDPTYRLGVRIESIAANVFYPIWHPSNYRQLLAVMISYRVTKEQAKTVWGKEIEEDYGVYSEIWTADEYTIRIGDNVLVSEKNPYVHPKTSKGIIPFVYIPRMRTGSFFGQSIFDGITGLVQEYNARTADVGDAVDDTSHRKVWGRNLRGTQVPNLSEIPNGDVINLGDSVPGFESAPPEIGNLETAQLPESVMPFIGLLQEEMREKTHTAPVILGIDEGSQRSSLTLSMRAMPTTSAARDYRGSWLMGLAYMADLTFLAMYVQPDQSVPLSQPGQRANGITPAAFDYWILADFSPILPRDREALVNETVTLFGANLRSLRFSLQRLGDVRDIEAEIARIEEEAAVKREQEMDLAREEAKMRFGSAPPGGGRPSSSSSGRGKRPSSSGTSSRAKPRSTPAD